MGSCLLLEGHRAQLMADKRPIILSAGGPQDTGGSKVPGITIAGVLIGLRSPSSSWLAGVESKVSTIKAVLILLWISCCVHKERLWHGSLQESLSFVAIYCLGIVVIL